MKRAPPKTNPNSKQQKTTSNQLKPQKIAVPQTIQSLNHQIVVQDIPLEYIHSQIFFLCLIIYFTICTGLPEGFCPVAPSDRQECGYIGIKKDECLAKSCCWDDKTDGAKWCYRQPGKYITWKI